MGDVVKKYYFANMPAILEKDIIIEDIKKMPKSSQVNDIIEMLQFKMNVSTGLKELDASLGISHEEVKRLVKEWNIK